MTHESTATRPFEPPSAAEVEAIRQVIADDYYGAWFDADPERMARSIHPHLAKRGWLPDANGEPFLDVDTFETMIEWTRRGLGRSDDPDQRALDVRVVEVHDDIATALAHAARYVETLQLIRTPDGWRILNALWRRP